MVILLNRVPYNTTKCLIFGFISTQYIFVYKNDSLVDSCEFSPIAYLLLLDVYVLEPFFWTTDLIEIDYHAPLSISLILS